jgi:signal transduction histidine kinase
MPALRSLRRLVASFRSRLILGAVVWITVGVAASGLALSGLYRDYVTRNFDDELRGHVQEMVDLIAFDAAGAPNVSRALSDSRFLPPRSGYYWQVDMAGRPAALSPSLAGRGLTLPPAPPEGVDRVVEAAGPSGPVRAVEQQVRRPGWPRPLRVVMGADRRLLTDLLAQFNASLAASLAIIALGLIAAAVAQVYLGLRPLGRMRDALGAIRRGEASSLPDDLPSEVAPLANDLNALLEANREMVRRARVQAGNLAHGLKTPLSILMDEGQRLAAGGQAEAGETILRQGERMLRQIDYEMARARAAASGAVPGAAAAVGPVAEMVIAAMTRLYPQQSFEMDGDPALPVACEADDLNEILANLLDNAAKWAARRVRLSIGRLDGQVRIVVDDDGPGVSPEARERIFQVGERLDERRPGSGLGLAIVRDLTSRYGGKVWIDDGVLGGAAVSVVLPLAAGAGGHAA